MTSFNRSIADSNNPYWVWGPLVFTGFYFLPVIFNFSQISNFDLAGIFSIFIGFLLLYRQAVYARGEHAIIWLIALTILVSLGTSFTFGTQSLFGYIAFVAGFNLSFKKSSTGLLVLCSAIILSAYFFTDLNIYFYLPALLMSIGLFVFGFSTQRDVIHRIKEAHSQEKIEQLATIAERERIARDLHDLIGHSLSSIALKAELADKYLSLKEQSKAQQEISEVAILSREILSEVRQAVSGLKKQNLSNSLNKLMAELINQNFTVECNNKLKTLSATIESTLVLILTEAVTNILRHSTGDKVALELWQENNQVKLTIHDNGHCDDFIQGNGLQGIHERCQQLNGQLSIDNKQGFMLNITLPETQNL